MMPRDCGARQLPVPGGASVLRDRIFFDRGQLNECTHSILVWPRTDLVARLEPPHSKIDSQDDPSHVIAQDEREAL
jgi:hypothetical protein